MKEIKNNEKVISDETVIKLKPVHLYSFLSLFIFILITIFTFFFNMLNTKDSELDSKIKEKIDKEIYLLDKTYTRNDIKELEDMSRTTLSTVKNINEDVNDIKIKIGIIEGTKSVAPSSLTPSID